jgi:hypothetical protein
MRPPPSGKPLVERLQVKGARRLAVLHAPDGLAPLFGANDRLAPATEAEVVVAFAATRGEMEMRLAELKNSTRPRAILWLAYPKTTSPRAGDISRDLIHDYALTVGLDAVAQIAIDTDYSALRFKRVRCGDPLLTIADPAQGAPRSQKSDRRSCGAH